MDFLQMMTLEPQGADVWVGTGPQYPWGGLYGGQIVAQALRAAAHSVDSKFLVHSLHAYFIRRGDHEAPVSYRVDRVRDGRSFMTRSVVAQQSSGAILNLSASFQLHQTEATQQKAVAPVVPGPEALQDSSWSKLFERRSVPNEHLGQGDTRRCAWLRVVGALPNDPLLHACALAYVSDDLPTEAVIARHPDHVRDPSTQFSIASLDHAVWFHGAVQADAHQLYQADCQALRGGRGLSVGHAFDAAGNLLATINQEVLVRVKK